MIRLQTYGVIKEGKLKIINIKLLKSEIGKLPEGNYNLTIEKQYSRRSNPQNAYLWGVVYPIVKQGLIDAGFDEFKQDYELEITHELCKYRFLEKEIVGNKDSIRMIGSTKDLTTTLFMEYLSEIQKWASEYLQVFIPEPDPNYVNANELH